MIEQLRYVRFRVACLDQAAAFAAEVLGLQLAARDERSCSFRCGKHAYTLMLDCDKGEAPAVGFSVRDVAALEAAGERLARHGRALAVGDAEGAARRGVRAFATFDDHSGNRIELVVRALDSGWRSHGARDAGVTGLEAVALKNTDVEADQALWTDGLGAHVSDWAGETAYIATDHAHHRIALHSSPVGGLLAVEFAVENVDLLMQNSYFLQEAQVRILHGPGRRPTSGQLFLTFESPFGALVSFVSEGDTAAAARRPRQFPAAPRSFDVWGSDNRLPDGLCAAAAA